MEFQARYDRQQDRMLLRLEAADGLPRAFWVTRHQWLSCLHALSVFARSFPAEQTTRPGRSDGPGETRKAMTVPSSGRPVAPQLLSAMRFRRKADILQMILDAGDGDASQGAALLTLRPSGVRKMLDMLENQAERAGWDVGAALARLDAGAMAGAAVSRARKRP